MEIETTDTKMEIRDIVDISSGDPLGWYCKGFHDPTKFFEAIAKTYNLNIEEEIGCIGDVEHLHWRNVPVKNGECSIRFMAAEKGTQGAYPVTAITF